MKSSPNVGNNMKVRYLMNKKEELKAHIIKCCVEGNMTVKQAANRLGFSERYVKKLKARYKKYTLHGLIDDASGQITGLYMCKNECMQ